MKKKAEDFLLKASLSFSWTEPFKILAVGPPATSVPPDGYTGLRANSSTPDVPSDAQGPDSRRRVSFVCCKPCWNPYDTDGIPQVPAGEFSAYALHSFDSESPLFQVTPGDGSIPEATAKWIRPWLANSFAVQMVL